MPARARRSECTPLGLPPVRGPVYPVPSMAIAQIQSSAPEELVRSAIEQELTARGGVTVENRAGQLVMDLGGTVKSAYLAGGFRDKMKMPMRLILSTAGGPGGTGATLDVHSRGTGSGTMSGGWLGAVKQSKAEQIWLQTAVDAVPQKVAATSPPPQAPPPA